jgi:hypothetical protein
LGVFINWNVMVINIFCASLYWTYSR